MNIGRLPEELAQAVEVYQRFQDRWQQEGPLFQQRSLPQDLQAKQFSHLDMQDKVNRKKLRIQLQNLRGRREQSITDCNYNEAEDVSVFILFCQGDGLTILQPQLCTVVNYSKIEGAIADFSVSQSWEWLLIVIRDDFFNNRMLGQRTTMKQLTTEIRDNKLCGLLQLGRPVWVFAYPLHQTAYTYGTNFRAGATLRFGKGQINKVEGNFLGRSAIRVDYYRCGQVKVKSPISDFYVNVVGASTQYLHANNMLNTGDMELELITQVLAEQGEDQQDSFSHRSTFTVVDENHKQPKFYNYLQKTGPQPHVSLIKTENDCAICGYEAATYTGLCLHISNQHGMLISTFEGNSINIRINQKYLDAAGEFMMPDDMAADDKEFVMVSGKIKRRKILKELKSQICLEDTSQQFRISASPSKQVNLGKLSIGEQKGQKQGSKKPNITPTKFDSRRQAEKRDKYIAQFGTRFYSSRTQAPITQEQLENLKDSDDEFQGDIELQKQLAWAEIEENLQCFSVNARKVKFLWKLHLQYNPCHADKYLFDAADNFVQKNKEELSESLDMIREVQVHFLAFYQRFQLLTVAQIAALLRPLRNQFYSKQQNKQ